MKICILTRKKKDDYMSTLTNMESGELAHTALSLVKMSAKKISKEKGISYNIAFRAVCETITEQAYIEDEEILTMTGESRR